MKIRKWYFAFNQFAIPAYRQMIQAAVMSCQENTLLRPVCIYDGDDDSLLIWLQKRGVFVIRRSVSISAAIKAVPDSPGFGKEIASGAYLRIDIPIIELEEDFVLYTDVDVLFLKEPNFEFEEPEFFACAPERRKDDWQHVNTGSMIINIKRMREEHSAFAAFASAGLKGFPAYDQGALNEFFAGRWSRLPLKLNWKPYWGLNRDAEIVHFHGPKPQHLERLIQLEGKDCPPIYRVIFQEDPVGQAYWLGRFHTYQNSLLRTAGSSAE